MYRNSRTYCRGVVVQVSSCGVPACAFGFMCSPNFDEPNIGHALSFLEAAMACIECQVRLRDQVNQFGPYTISYS